MARHNWPVFFLCSVVVQEIRFVFCDVRYYVITYIYIPGSGFHLSEVKHVGVKCRGHGHTIETMSQR